MSVGKASIARAVNAEKASKTETKTVKEAEVKAAEKPAEVKAETAEKAAEKPKPVTKKTAAKAPAKKTTARKTSAAKTTAKKTTTRKTTARKTTAKKTAAAEATGTVAQNVIAGGNADELQAKFLTPKKEQPDNNQPVGIKDELPVYLL